LNSNTFTKRLGTIKWIVLAYLVLLAGRMVCLQVVQHDQLLGRVHAQTTERRALAAERGNLFDRQGRSLALSITTWDVGLAPSAYRGRPKGELEANADRLARMLEVDPAEVRSRLRQAGDGFLYIAKRAVLHRDSLAVLPWIPGVSYDVRRDRIYPVGGVAASLIGMYREEGKNGDVLSGLEQGYDDWLRGTPGEALWHHTPNRGPGDSFEAVIPAVNGLDLELTIDASLQAIAEDCLSEALVETSSQAGVVLIVDPHTGDILAAADAPVVRERSDITDFNTFWNNYNFTGAYEPGSVFKLFTGVSLLRRGAIDTVMTIDCDDINFGGYDVHNDMNHKYGELAFMEAFAHSSNVFFARAVLNLSEKEFLDDLHLLGFDRALGVPYPSATRGILADRKDWERRRMPTIAYGQAIATTPLHLVLAASVVANGGELMAPRLIRQVRTKAGRVVETFEPVARHRVIDEDLAMLLRHALGRAVTSGTGAKAAVSWTTVGGKTGTAEKVVEGDTTYTPGAYMASFLGIVPVENPRLVILTMVDQPNYAHHYASESAAPLFRNVVEGIGRNTSWLDGVTETKVDDDLFEPVLSAVPDVRYLTQETASRELGRMGFVTPVISGDGLVIAQTPTAGTRLASGDTVSLIMGQQDALASGAAKRCPDLSGLSTREVRRRLAPLDMNVNCEGSGYVVSQSPEPGVLLEGRTIQVRLETSWR
jgi:stage V sporulation protein D (sporulation-specific penicillin-binding protein)